MDEYNSNIPSNRFIVSSLRFISPPSPSHERRYPQDEDNSLFELVR